MFTLRKKAKQAGFTLMELLIVIAILGLLLGLIAPRLGGITAGTADNVCDTNNKGIRGMTALYLETNGRLPGTLTNMIIESAAGTGTLVQTQFGGDTANAEEVLSAAFTSRNFPGLWTLSQAEVNELVAMGVNRVVHHEGVAAGDTVVRPDAKDALAANDEVMMLGITNSSGTAALADLISTNVVTVSDGGSGTEDVPLYGDAATAATATMASATEVGNPNWIGRIVMAVNDECDLITSGLITASALCPTAVLADGLFSHEEFFIILPRLQATVTAGVGLFDGTTMGGLDTSDADSEKWVAGTYVDASNTTTGKQMEVAWEAQEAWQFEVSCPEGHKWPAADAENWTAN